VRCGLGGYPRSVAEHTTTAGRIEASLGVKPGERGLVRWVTALFAVCFAAVSLVLNSADALFFLRFGVEFLPRMILASGLVVMVAILAYMAGLGRLGARRWSPWAFVAIVLLLAVERAGIAIEAPGIYPVVWLGGQVSIMVVLTALWNVAAEVCDTRQAKRLFPLLASAGIAGGIVGNLATGPLASALGTENLVVVAAMLFAVASVLATGVGKRFFISAEVDHSPLLAGLRHGIKVTFSSRMMRLVAFVGLAMNILFFLVAFPFSDAVAASFDSEPEVAGFLGYFSSFATAVTFVVSLFVANRLVNRLGVVATMLIVPVVYLAGFATWVIAFDLRTAAAVRGAQWVAVNAFGSAAWGALFNVLPRRHRGTVMAFVSAVPVQVGTSISGLILVAGTELSETQRFLTGAVLAATTCVVVWRMRRAYTQALLDAVKGGFVEVFSAVGAGFRSMTVGAEAIDAVQEAMSEEAPEARVMAVTMLASMDGAPREAGRLLHEAFEDGDPRVRTAVVHALGKGTLDDPLVLDAAQTDPSPTVRLAAVEELARRDAKDMLSQDVLSDPDPRVRGRAAGLIGDLNAIASLLESTASSDQLAGLEAVASLPSHEFELSRFLGHESRRFRSAAGIAMASTDPTAVIPLLDDPTPSTRRAVADRLADNDSGRAALRAVLEDGSVRATDAALSALVREPGSADGLVAWADGETDRVAYLRHHRLALSEAGSELPEAAFLLRLLEMRERTLSRWAARALTSTASSDTVETVMRGISADDSDLRSQAMEALETVADRHVARRLLGMMEDDRRDEESARHISSLQTLAEDFDPWIRASATKWLAAELHSRLTGLHRATREDPSTLVRDSLQGLSPPQMREPKTLTPMECVIALSRVPLFSDLDPEDMERLAEVTSQRRYGADEMIYREGARGEEMLIILQGEAVASRSRDDEAKVIRTFGPGDHVGELALLRGQPRVSDVVAGPEGAQALALGKAEFQAILEERPEVALIMLGTLADRIAAG